jgi:hypothetical protein
MTNIFRTSIGFLILIRVWFLQIALKSKNIYLTKDSDHYIELSKDINYFFFNDNLIDYWLSTFRLPGYPVVLNIFSNFLDIKYAVYINFVADLVTLFLLYKLLSMYFESNFTYI